MTDPQVTPSHNLRYPRITIQFCTQCKWNLRAAYFAQELLQTFATSLGEVSLQPSTGGVFVVDITYSDPENPAILHHRILWDRKTDGGFPETKELKRRVRDVIEPERDLGHVDRDYPRKTEGGGDMADQKTETKQTESTGAGTGTGPALPRPRDIAARAHTLTHPNGAPEPVGHQWGTKDDDRKVPAGIGGKKPIVPKPPTKADGDDKGTGEKCEDCA